MPDRNAAPKLTKSAATATTTIVHIRPASTSPPASAGSRVRASSTIAMKGMTPLIAPITLKAMMPARLRRTGAKNDSCVVAPPFRSTSIATPSHRRKRPLVE